MDIETLELHLAAKAIAVQTAEIGKAHGITLSSNPSLVRLVAALSAFEKKHPPISFRTPPNKGANPMTDKTIKVWVAVDPVGKITHPDCWSTESAYEARSFTAAMTRKPWYRLENEGWTIRPATLTIRS
jgi:hypothetical protein